MSSASTGLSSQGESSTREVSVNYDAYLCEASYILEDEVTSTIVIQRLHPIGDTGSGAHQRSPRRLLPCKQLANPNIIRPNPKRKDRLIEIHIDRPVRNLGEIRRQLALEHRGVDPRREVVRTRRTCSREGEERDVGVVGYVERPCGSAVTG